MMMVLFIATARRMADLQMNILPCCREEVCSGGVWRFMKSRPIQHNRLISTRFAYADHFLHFAGLVGETFCRHLLFLWAEGVAAFFRG